MDDAARADVVKRLAVAFGDARDVTPTPEQPLHVLIPALDLPDPWTPSPTSALIVWEGWPTTRPTLYIDAKVTGETGEPPRSFTPTYVLGATWNAFSFSFEWKGDNPVRAVQTWLTRFEVERT